MHENHLSRRQFLAGAGSWAVASSLGVAGIYSIIPANAAKPAPTSPVSLAHCRNYEFTTVLEKLDRMFDQLGGLKKRVQGKTVAVKVNLTGNPKHLAVGLPASRTFQTHPNVAMALATLLDRAGARRIRFLEGTYQLGPFEDHLIAAGWDLKALEALDAQVEYEDTRNLGHGRQYHRVKPPWGGSLFPAYELNHSYVDCDFYVSLAKLKNHYTAGVTLSVKNNFGITPTALYGQGEHDENSTNARVKIFHEGAIQPANGLPREIDPDSPRRSSYRVPRHTVDSIGIRPIDLAVIDGIETVSGGEGPWIRDLRYQKPDLLIAGYNAVCTDAIATAAMGYDPLATSGTGPFPGDNHLKLAMDLGLGTCDPKGIEVLGLPLEKALHPFRWEPPARHY